MAKKRDKLKMKSHMLLKGSLLSVILSIALLPGSAKAIEVSDSTLTKTGQTEAFAAAPAEVRYFSNIKSPLTTSDLDPIIIPRQTFADSTEYYRSKAFEYQTEVLRRNAMIGNLNDLYSLQLPVGLASKDGDPNYAVIITEIKGDSRGPVLEAYFLFELPQTGDKIAFRGKNIKFSHDGALIGTGRMELIGSYPIKLNDKTLLTVLGRGNTFVEFDCNGFKGMGIEGEVQFSRDLIIPEDEAGKQKPSPERVKTIFSIQAQSWNDMLVGVSLPPFQVNGLNDFGFTVTEAYLDFSDIVNPPGFSFPAGYTSSFQDAGQSQLWQGFYLQRLAVRLPSSFTKKRNNSRISIGLERMILDDQGFSGLIFAENVLELGDMNGWSYSLKRVGIELVTNQVKGFELAGDISVPVLKSKEGKATQFGYLAQRSTSGNYLFAVTINSEVRLPLYVAEAKLHPMSVVTVQERDGKFYPSANLNGALSINVSSRGPKAKFNIRFENMIISSEAPHFTAGSFSFGGDDQPSSMSKYPVVISNIGVKSETNRVGLAFNLTINISGSAEDEGFGGTAALTIWAKKEAEEIKNAEGQVIDIDESAWKYETTELSGVGVNVSKPGVIDLAGMINFFDEDPTYGEGFQGSLRGKIQSITLQADVLFGKTPTFRYWYADALVGLPAGIPIMPAVLSAYGFGGGFYYKMKQSTVASASALGRTQSGITYVPDENTFGIRAIVLIGAARKEAWNGDVALEVSLNRHGGINSVTFTGNANFMSPLAVAGDKIKELASSAVGGVLSDKLASLVRGQVYGSVMLHFDNINDVFHGNLEIYINVAGGLVKGIGPGSKAGWAVIHFERSDWYVLIGTPDQPIGLEVAKIFKASSYFMLGKHLPGSPPPPIQVSQILGNVDLDYMRDMNALESGVGFAFGLHFLVDTGDLSFLMFYGRFAAGTGIDFMLKDYGRDCRCEGQSGSIGIDGWYANGQAYAFVQGSIGIKVKLKFVRGKFEILAIGAAAVLQAKGPNPFWMHGMVGGYYRILGGLVKGKCRFEVTIGKECKIVIPQTPREEVNPLEDVEIIAELSPVKDSKDVDVFTAPQVAFNMPIGEVFEIGDDAYTSKLFRARLDTYQIMDGAAVIAGTIRWNDTNDVVAFDAFEVLPPKKQLKAIVKVVFEEYVGSSWRTLNFEGKPLEERKETVFITGDAPDYIPPSNVDIAYPDIGQFNFYPKEYNQGFIVLKKGQSYLFKPNADWIQKLHVKDAASTSYLETDLGYNEGEKRVYFNLPAGLQNSRPYRLEILNFPKQNQVLDANVITVENDRSTNDDSLTVSTKEIEGNFELKDIKTVYSALFRTSSFNTFKEKVSAISLSSTFRLTVGMDVFQLAAYLRGNELFSEAEIDGAFKDRHVQFEAILDQNDWYQKAIYPLVYEGYPLLSGMAIRFRDVTELGFPPVKSLYIVQPGYSPVLTEETLSATYSLPSVYNTVRYDLEVPMLSDYYDIQNQVANYVVDNISTISFSARFNTLLATPFPHFSPGRYRMKIKYVIPRINQTTSTHEWELFKQN